MNWFKKEYGDAKATPVLMHPSVTFEWDASPPPDTIVIDKMGIEAFREAARQFFSSISTRLDDLKHIQDALQQHHLTRGQILSKFGRRAKIGTKP